jgi:hypothetical protein
MLPDSRSSEQRQRRGEEKGLTKQLKKKERFGKTVEKESWRSVRFAMDSCFSTTSVPLKLYQHKYLPCLMLKFCEGGGVRICPEGGKQP